ncbi:unnamed protein product [Soboliphyme baturini]|uniref:CN hydrolase domain-containing protein n=1 Tax=Soboliphyme baturini TaxID=241478 RepID=A0A183IJZ3_9BILA|nr:unnamed protein product [Soboliphyme baturini]
MENWESSEGELELANGVLRDPAGTVVTKVELKTELAVVKSIFVRCSSLVMNRAPWLKNRSTGLTCLDIVRSRDIRESLGVTVTASSY